MKVPIFISLTALLFIPSLAILTGEAKQRELNKMPDDHRCLNKLPVCFMCSKLVAKLLR